MLDEMCQTLLIISLGRRAEINGHAHEDLVLGALVRADGVAQPVRQLPVNDCCIWFEVRRLGVPRRCPLRPCGRRAHGFGKS